MNLPLGDYASMLVLIFWTFSSVLTQDLLERDAICDPDGCLVAYFRPKTFLDSWRSCKEKGGNLATIKRQSDAAAVHSLLTTTDLRQSRTKIRVWIGLQRQPRQCAPNRPLRGFSWTTGDQDTEYTNWQKEYSHAMCSIPRCVAMGYNTLEPGENFKWLDGSCSIPADGYLCHYAYQGMCPALWNQGAGHPFYTTPFDLLTTLLTHLPLGSVATIPCEAGQESVDCLTKEDGSIGWSRDPPLCPNSPPSQDWCQRDNGGCEHFCKQAAAHSYCECAEGYRLGDDGQSCVGSDACREANCQFECVPLSEGYRCACPEGYMLTADEHGCEDVDECLQSPCEHGCVNSPGSFQCHCRQGYRLDHQGTCQDLDECLSDPCEHACENTEGSFVCHCRLGYLLQPEDPLRCQDTDECQIVGTCQQMCVNYVGGFECYCEEGYQLVVTDSSSCQKIGEGTDDVTPVDPWPTPVWGPVDYEWTPQRTDWDSEGGQSLDWLTEAPKVWDSDVIWVTSGPLEDIFNPDPETITQEEDLQTTVKTTHAPPTQSTTLFTPTMEYYEDDYQEEDLETTPLPKSSTSTISEGAWNWWAGFSTPGNPEGYVTRLYYPSEEDKQSVGTENPGQDWSRDVPTTLNPETTVTIRRSEPEQEVQGLGQGTTWLLVGLLVPIILFVVLIVVLGVVYRTRCAARPRNKDDNDCYHWISGAHDKRGAAGPPAGVKSNV
ncbi:CD248 molecule, endosialin a [Stigmatopora nigra]